MIFWEKCVCDKLRNFFSLLLKCANGIMQRQYILCSQVMVWYKGVCNKFSSTPNAYERNYAGTVRYVFPSNLLGKELVENIFPPLPKCMNGIMQGQYSMSSQVIFWEKCVCIMLRIFSPLLLKCAKGFFQRQSRISSQVIFWEEWSSKYLLKAESNGRMEGNS